MNVVESTERPGGDGDRPNGKICLSSNSVDGEKTNGEYMTASEQVVDVVVAVPSSAGDAVVACTKKTKYRYKMPAVYANFLKLSESGSL